MKIKIILLVCFSLISSLIIQRPAYSTDETTAWEDVKISLSDLLNNGWQLTNHGISNTSWPSKTTNNGQILSSTTDSEFTFVLRKGSKHIICLISNPTPGNGKSNCRKLN
jgi:hypothetical protein